MLRVEATLTGFSGGPGLAQFFFSPAVAPEDDVLAGLACTRVVNAYTSARNLFPSEWSVSVSGEVLQIDPATGEQTGSLSGGGGSVSGGVGGGTAWGPSPVGLLTRFATSEFVAGRRVRGHTFHVPVLQAAFSPDGTPDTGYLAYAAAFGDSMRDAGATDCVFGIWSRPKRDKVTHAVVRPGSFHGVTSSSAPDKAVVLRSRRD